MTIRQVRIVYYLLFGLFWFSTSLLAPLYVLYLMQRGLDLGDIGLWAGANTLAVVLLELPTGGLADAWGRGRTFASANLIIAFSLMLMVLVPGRGVLFAGAAVFGAGRALSSGSLDAWFVDALKNADPEIDIEKELGPAGAVTLGALAAGSLLGSLLPTLPFASALPGGLPSLALPLLGDAALKVVLAFLTLALIKDQDHGNDVTGALYASLRTLPGTLSSIRRVRTGNPRLGWILAGGTAIAFAAGSLENFWQPRFAGLSGRESGLAFGGVMAASFLAAGIGSLLAPKVTAAFGGRRHRTAFLFGLLTSGALVLLSFSRSSLSMAAGLSLVYFLMEGVGVPRRAMLNDAVSADLRATMLSVDSLCSYLGFGGIILLGFLADRAGIPVVWRAAAGVMFPASWLYRRLKRMDDYGAQNPGRNDGRGTEGSDTRRRVG